ncbi:hypothetical protein L6164_023512 [Bauhinia variegata]|uniref:Uncharacterized protein n=1 Tax=Bauhinia variegata TaxID=167791 RepID=A0ACB9MLV0_BAUVA|nr:hypothetical protein L6164_023512 [Bauhinia variegata]
MFGSRLFAMAKEIGMMSEGYVWILTSEMTNQLASLNSSITDTMQGVLGLGAYFPKTKEFQHFQVGWKSKFQQENPTIIGPELNVYCLWAYDAVTALAMAVEKAGVKEFGFQNTSIYSSSTTNFETDLGVSLIGPKLRKSLSETRFRGLSGSRILDTRKWTDKKSQFNKDTDTGTYSTSKTNLGPIIWPGDSSFVPEGWDLLANRKKLRIGIPVEPGYGLDELVSAHYDPVTNGINVSGYCIDVFKVVMDALPYHVPYEFIPFNPRDNENFSTGSFYDDLMREVYLGKFDAAVGDTTIRAERSLYVDFMVPFTENEATFIVPIKQKRVKDACVFLKPLTWELWVTSVCFFVFIGFVVWLLERGVNKEEFRGSPSDQVGQRIHSNLARFVVIIWVFVGLILTQSYTASLTTLLTVEHLRPAVTDVNQLIQSGDYIGHQHGSSIIEFLRKMGFDVTKLRVVNSIEESDYLLTLGSRNGGIAAAFAETPYIKVMQSRYCSKYTTIGPCYQSQGFGFVSAFQLSPHI